MACCVFTAYVMNRIIKACEVLDIKLIDIQYNDFDDDDVEAKVDVSKTTLSKLALDGMTCGACVTTIEKALNSLHGVEAVSVSLVLARATVVHEHRLIPLSKIITTIQDAGYDAQEGERSAQQNLDVAEQKHRLSSLRISFSHAMTLSTLLVFLNSFLGYLSHKVIFSSSALALIGGWTQLIVAKDIHRAAWNKRCLTRPNMDFLISLSIVLGLILAATEMYQSRYQPAINYVTSGSFLVAVVLGGRYIRALLEKQTASGLAQLYDLQAKTTMVKVRDRDTQIRLPALALRPNQEIVLDPGSIIPCDCYVISERGLIDESSMTGESLPKVCGTGDFLMSGTRVLGSTIVAIVSHSQEDSALEQLITSISIATESEHNESTDFLTVRFVQIVLVLAIYTFITASVGHAGGFFSKTCIAMERAMAVLASACPCALGLATPSAVLSGISVAWNKGIVFTGGIDAIKQLTNLTHVVMDKTGTLTTGRLDVARIMGSLSSNNCMLICAAEKRDASVHPVARVVFKWALSRLTEAERSEQNSLQISDQVSDPGKGVRCVLTKGDGKTYSIRIGTSIYLQEHGVQLNDLHKSDCTGGIVVDIAVNGHHVGSLLLQDSVRPEAPRVIDYLKNSLSVDLAMLTGDLEAEAERISSALAISVASSRALPHAKKTFVQAIQMQSSRNRVAMIGDGVNDTPALSQADVGILISSGLSRSNRMCVQAADVILTNPSLGGLIEAILIARAMEKQIRINRGWALCYNLAAVTVAMGVFERWGLTINASMAGTLMASSSISVVALSLLLRARLQKINFESEGGISEEKTELDVR